MSWQKFKRFPGLWTLSGSLFIDTCASSISCFFSVWTLADFLVESKKRKHSANQRNALLTILIIQYWQQTSTLKQHYSTVILKKKASKRFDRIAHMDPSLSESFCRTLPTNELPAVYNTSTLSLLVNKACRSKTLEGVCVCACTWVCVNLHICPWIKSKLLFLSPYRSASLTLLAISFNFFPFHSLSSCHSHLLFLFFPPCGN